MKPFPITTKALAAFAMAGLTFLGEILDSDAITYELCLSDLTAEDELYRDTFKNIIFTYALTDTLDLYAFQDSTYAHLYDSSALKGTILRRKSDQLRSSYTSYLPTYAELPSTLQDKFTDESCYYTDSTIEDNVDMIDFCKAYNKGIASAEYLPEDSFIPFAEIEMEDEVFSESTTEDALVLNRRIAIGTRLCDVLIDYAWDDMLESMLNWLIQEELLKSISDSHIDSDKVHILDVLPSAESLYQSDPGHGTSDGEVDWDGYYSDGVHANADGYNLTSEGDMYNDGYNHTLDGDIYDTVGQQYNVDMVGYYAEDPPGEQYPTDPTVYENSTSMDIVFVHEKPTTEEKPTEQDGSTAEENHTEYQGPPLYNTSISEQYPTAVQDSAAYEYYSTEGTAYLDQPNEAYVEAEPQSEQVANTDQEISVSEQANVDAEPIVDEPAYQTHLMSLVFDVRTESTSGLTEADYVDILRDELTNRIDTALSSLKRTLQRRALQDAIAMLQDVQVTLNQEECDPSEDGTNCYEVLAVISFSPLYENKSEVVMSLIEQSIYDGQTKGAFFSSLAGFKKLPSNQQGEVLEFNTRGNQTTELNSMPIQKNERKVGAIAGGVLCAVVVAGLLLFAMKRRKNNKRERCAQMAEEDWYLHDESSERDVAFSKTFLGKNGIYGSPAGSSKTHPNTPQRGEYDDDDHLEIYQSRSIGAASVASAVSQAAKSLAHSGVASLSSKKNSDSAKEQPIDSGLIGAAAEAKSEAKPKQGSVAPKVDAVSVGHSQAGVSLKSAVTQMSSAISTKSSKSVGSHKSSLSMMFASPFAKAYDHIRSVKSTPHNAKFEPPTSEQSMTVSQLRNQNGNAPSKVGTDISSVTSGKSSIALTGMTGFSKDKSEVKTANENKQVSRSVGGSTHGAEDNDVSSLKSWKSIVTASSGKVSESPSNITSPSSKSSDDNSIMSQIKRSLWGPQKQPLDWNKVTSIRNPPRGYSPEDVEMILETVHEDEKSSTSSLNDSTARNLKKMNWTTTPSFESDCGDEVQDQHGPLLSKTNGSQQAKTHQRRRSGSLGIATDLLNESLSNIAIATPEKHEDDKKSESGKSSASVKSLKSTVSLKPQKSGVSAKSALGMKNSAVKDVQNSATIGNEEKSQTSKRDSKSVSQDSKSAASSARKTSSRIQTGSPWMAVVDEATGNIYYYNEVTDETTWEKPKGYRDDTVVKPLIYTSKNEGKKASNGNWQAVVDKFSGKTYYFDTVTLQTTWDKPEGFDENNQAALYEDEDDDETDSEDGDENDVASKLKQQRRASNSSVKTDELGSLVTAPKKK